MMVRAWSKSLRVPSTCGESPKFVGGAPFIGPAASQSVHAAGISARLPSGRLASNSTTPRLRMLLMTDKVWPSKAWHLRVMITASGISR
jgi:hypothetical protein